MALIPWSDGIPGDRAGIAHTLKHWLDPREMWEDIADAVDAQLRPRAVLDALALPSPWDVAYTPTPELIARWTTLRAAYRQGYLSVVLAGAAAHASLPESWTPIDSGRRAAALPGGIFVVIAPSRGEWALATAHRPFDFKLLDPECPPRDAKSVHLRKMMTELAARKKLARKTQDDR
jgi:hypothetical protein